MSAGAIVIEPRRPAGTARRPTNRAMVSVRHLWILHQRRVTRALLAGVALACLGGVYLTRDAVGGAVAGLAETVYASATEAGFGVKAIEITGQALTRESDILAAMEIEPKTSTVEFDADAARQRIVALPAVASVTVRKIYPNRVVVDVVERQPVARWRVDGVTFLVDAEGEQIGEDHGAYGELPLVIGDGAADNALAMIRVLSLYPELEGGLAALSRIADRRWDMIYQSGVRVQLPEAGIAHALVLLRSFQRNYKLLDRDLTLIDLRVPDIVALLPAVHEVPPDPEATKKTR